MSGRPSLPRRLADWLAYLEKLHPTAIELSLDRVRTVRARLGLDPGFPIITVGGTNGKGSTCAFLEAMLVAAGRRVGCYTSPHLLAYNERVRIDGLPVTDAALCRAFATVEAARGEVSLTYFEFGTLAALLCFVEAGVEVAVLEVGMGGRLDAVNVFDAEVAVVTTVDLDHMAWLGPDREHIGREKAGIYRPGRPAICADCDPPATLVAYAQAIGADLRCLGRDFGWEPSTTGWRFWRRAGGHLVCLEALPPPALIGAYQYANAAAAVEALLALAPRVNIAEEAIRAGLAGVHLPGRFQVVPGPPQRILDVAHNPQGARMLAANLAQAPIAGRTLAVCAMLADKDMEGVVRALVDQVDAWFVAGLPPPRGAPATTLAASVRRLARGAPCATYADVRSAHAAACMAAAQGDRILIFGSFYTVAAVLAELTGSA
ncbi:bifunctional tetrahydrofolate synthase/dihydrofolate synthase [Thiobacter aerophilum]|uniref:Dihydrofolate synthase/folylpolyglutamate synthase n=1 Tax=Thiobacter aerophilum TaxID=3121275 RepID=A0ABV0EFX0_9BURK